MKREAIIDKQINIMAIDEFGYMWNFEDVSAIIFDGRDAIIKMTDKHLIKNMRLFEIMNISVVDREPEKEVN